MRILTRGVVATAATFLMAGGLAFAQNTPVGNTGRFEAASPCQRITDSTQRADCERANGPMNSEPFKDRGGGSRGNRSNDHKGQHAGKDSSSMKGDSGRGSSARTGGSGGGRSTVTSGGGGRSGGGGHGGGSGNSGSSGSGGGKK